jgi:hypothetical protein
MRISTIGRASAVVTATALALSVGTGPVAAAENDVSAAAAITSIRINSGVITGAGSTFFSGSVQVTGVPPQGVTAQTEVRINGTLRGLAAIGPNGVEIPRSWGSGPVVLGPTYFSDGTASAVPSNTFYARKQVKTMRRDGYALKVNRRNSRISFSARQIKVVNPSNGKYVSVKRVKLQQFKGGKWKTKKTIKLNSKGNGTYSTNLKKKYRYRLYTARTSTQERFVTLKTGKI